MIKQSSAIVLLERKERIENFLSLYNIISVDGHLVLKTEKPTEKRNEYLKSFWKRTNQKGTDRHLLPFATRYRLKILKDEFIKRDWEEGKSERKGDLNLFVNLFVEQKCQLSLFNFFNWNCRFFFCSSTHAKSNAVKLMRQLFRWYWLKDQKELLRLLNDNPRQFKKRLKEIDLLIIEKMSFRDNQKSEQVTKSQPVNKYSAPDYQELRNVYHLLLLRNKRGICGRIMREKEGVIDLDALDKDHPLYETQQQVFKNIVSYFIRNKLARKIVRSQNGGYHIYVNAEVDLNGSLLYWNGIKTGDFQGKGEIVIDDSSKGYQALDINFSSKIFKDKNEIAKHLKKFNFSFSPQLKEEILQPIQSFNLRSVSLINQSAIINSSLLPNLLLKQTNQTKSPSPFFKVLYDEDGQRILNFPKSKMDYQGKIELSDMLITEISKAFHHGHEQIRRMNGKCSRNPDYWFFQCLNKKTGQRWEGFVDKDYRKREFNRLENALKNGSFVNLTIRRGQKHSFLQSIQI